MFSVMKEFRELVLWGMLFLLALICLLSLLGITAAMFLSDDLFIVGGVGALLCWSSWRGVKRVLGALAS
jgi:hypothetical protein